MNGYPLFRYYKGSGQGLKGLIGFGFQYGSGLRVCCGNFHVESEDSLRHPGMNPPKNLAKTSAF